MFHLKQHLLSLSFDLMAALPGNRHLLFFILHPCHGNILRPTCSLLSFLVKASSKPWNKTATEKNNRFSWAVFCSECLLALIPIFLTSFYNLWNGQVSLKKDIHTCTQCTSHRNMIVNKRTATAVEWVTPQWGQSEEIMDICSVHSAHTHADDGECHLSVFKYKPCSNWRLIG